MAQRLTGGCQCGALRFESDGPVVDLYICHCGTCQCRRRREAVCARPQEASMTSRCTCQSASAFDISVLVERSRFRHLTGEVTIWTRPATVSGSLDCAFCPRCGSRVWHGNLARDAVIIIKGGSLDTLPELRQAKHIWTSQPLEGVVIPTGVDTYPEAGMA